MGWVYNLKTPDPHSQVPRVIAICLVFPIVAFLAVLLRLYVRIHTKRAAGVDDYAALFSSILAIAYGAISIARPICRRSRLHTGPARLQSLAFGLVPPYRRVRQGLPHRHHRRHRRLCL